VRKSITIKVETYNCSVVFVVTSELSKEIGKVYSKYKIKDFKLEDIQDGNEGILLSPDINKYHLLIDGVYLSHNTIAHEIYHAVVRITEDREVTDEEAQAWLCGYLTGAVYKFLEKKEVKVTHGNG
jgi:hypothetical protein